MNLEYPEICCDVSFKPSIKVYLTDMKIYSLQFCGDNFFVTKLYNFKIPSVYQTLMKTGQPENLSETLPKSLGEDHIHL